jgi:putative transposase
MKKAPQEIRTFFVTSITWGRRSLFQTERMARLLIDVLYDNREKKRFDLHEFVIMPEHFHLLLTPSYEIPLEKAVQYIKGGFSFRAKKELGFSGEIWQEGFTLRRIENSVDYERHREYIWQNPVKQGLCAAAEDHPYSSAHSGFVLDPVPPGLKPIFKGAAGSPA